MNEQASQIDNRIMPRARHEALLIHELADEVLVYDLKRNKAHCLNKTAALVWNRCDGETSVREMARFLEQNLRTAVHEDVVSLALLQLERASLLRESPSQTVGAVRLRRRDLMRRMGLAAAVLPLVVSILAPSAAQAQSAACGAAGATCVSKSECCAGLQCIGQANPKHCG